jgi:aspartate kinase
LLVVQKYGGSSLADSERMRHVAKVITDTYKRGADVVVVLSAQGDTTDELEAKALELNPKPSRREMDALLSCGESISIALMAMAIEAAGCPAISLTGRQAGISTDSSHTNARIKRIDTERMRRELEKRHIVLVAGFQGVNRFDDVTTLGRGGSNTSAVAVAAALGADLCQNFTDVDGVYTADPRIVPSARKLAEITYDEMLELASLGANVLQNRSVEMAKRFNVPLEVLSSFTPDVPGTLVKEMLTVENIQVSGVARDNNTARLSLVRLQDKPGVAAKVFSLLAREKINVDIILQSIGRDDTKDISFTVGAKCLDRAREVLTENREAIGFSELLIADNISKVSAVGAGMVNNPGVAARMFEALSAAGINIQMISTSEIKVSVLVDREDSDRAVRVIHEAFFG